MRSGQPYRDCDSPHLSIHRVSAVSRIMKQSNQEICVPHPPVHAGVRNQEPCIAFAVNHFSMSDRSQPPEMCFGGNSPFLHHRKSVERLTPTTRTTSLVRMRASMPASRSAMSVGVRVSAGATFGLTGGTTSMSDSCTGRSPLTAFCRLETGMVERSRPEGRCISRLFVIVVPGPLGTVTAPGDRIEVLIASPPNATPALLPDRCLTLPHRVTYP